MYELAGGGGGGSLNFSGNWSIGWRFESRLRKPNKIGKSKINKKASTSVISGKFLG